MITLYQAVLPSRLMKSGLEMTHILLKETEINPEPVFGELQMGARSWRQGENSGKGLVDLLHSWGFA